MKGTIKISCDSVEYINTSHYKGNIELTLINPTLEDISDLAREQIAEYLTKEDTEKLFTTLIESDEELLHSYLEKSGYLFSKM